MNAPLTSLEMFRAKGVPNRRVEEWKYSDLRQAVDAADVERAPQLALTTTVPPEVEMSEVAQSEISVQSQGPATTMEAAASVFSNNVLMFRVADCVHVDSPLTLEFLGGGHRQIRLYLGKKASLTLTEFDRDAGCAQGLRNIALSIHLEEGASLTHIREAPFAASLASVETVSVMQERDSSYRVHLVEGGAKLSRAEWRVTLNGEGATADLSGISVLSDGAHADVTTRIDHAVPKTTSRQLFKNVAGGKSRAIYQGKIVVHEGAVGSDSRQTAKALLLSHHAEADLKPELEIFADDVKCAHGAAVGDLDAESLFYLRSRGIPEDEARALLIKGFLGEVVDTFETEEMRAAAWRFIEDGLVNAMKPSP